jgi:uncharacterized protein
MSKPFRILSIDGGGIRGVYPAHILSCLESRMGIDLFESFDMIAGTSTGSIIAAAIAIRIRASETVSLFKEHGKRIFTKKDFCIPFKKEMFQPAFDSVYESNVLANVLRSTFQDITLGEIKKPLIIPSTDIGNGTVHVLKSGYSNNFTRDRDVLVRDAVLASSSAPTFFDPCKLNAYLLADGGLWANNPSLASVIESQKRLGVDLDDIRVLSLGTGHERKRYGTEESRKWGLINGWKHKEFIGFILSLQSQSVENYLSLMLKPGQFLRVNFTSDKALPLDDASEISSLISRADHDFTHQSDAIRSFLVD